MIKTYPFSASQFVQWATHPIIISRVRGIIEHHCHHEAVKKYQLTIVPRPTTDQSWFSAENMPDIVRLASLSMSEERIQCYHKDFRMFGRLDQLYRYSNFFFLVDSKSHKQPTFSDQLQLSFYSFILCSNGYAMGDLAFIRSIYDGKPEYHEVEIIPWAAMSEIINEVE